jgi:hypothetical protein
MTYFLTDYRGNPDLKMSGFYMFHKNCFQQLFGADPRSITKSFVRKPKVGPHCFKTLFFLGFTPTVFYHMHLSQDLALFQARSAFGLKRKRASSPKYCDIFFKDEIF